MPDFQLDTAALDDHVQRARRAPSADVVDGACERARHGIGLDPMELAGLWFAPLDSETLYQRVREARRARALQLETFSPLYLTNTCDAECRMCGMRRDNQALRRETADLADVYEQLRILSARGMRAVALLTGEYAAANRPWAMRYVNQALRYTQELGFKHVLINVGSIDTHEFDTLLDGMPRHADGSLVPFLTMSTFQETYAPGTYAQVHRDQPGQPARRLPAPPDQLRSRLPRRHAGRESGHPGGPQPGSRLRDDRAGTALSASARRSAWRSTSPCRACARSPAAAVKAASAMPTSSGSSSLLSLGLPTCKIVITTRENAAIQHKLAPIVSVISAGSAAVTPYTETGARFPLETSQFEVIDQRPFEEILREHLAPGGVIENFQPPAA